ncbi:MAG: GNAT family N-acetyltransferase [Pseudomonadota bacterium]
MSERFFSASDPSTSYMNRADFVEVLEQIYNIRRCHALAQRDEETTGVPAFEVSSLLSGRKITTMPFNYYPPLTGAGNNLVAMETLSGMARARGRGWFAEYKTFERLPTDYIESAGLIELVFSTVSELRLADSYDEQRTYYKSRHRTKVNKARRELSELDIDATTATVDLGQWYELLTRLYRDKHRMICQPFALYERFLQLADGSLLLVAKHQGSVVGGLFILRDGVRWDYCWGAMQPGYDRRDVATLLLDDAIRRAIEAEAKVFGFGSSAPSDKDLLFFKQRWGCEERPVYAYYWNHAPKPIDLNESFSFARGVINKMPLSLLRLASKMLVPHLV